MTGFDSKRAAAADKLQEPWNEDEWRKNNWRCSHGWLRGEQCEICNAPQPAQEPVAWAIYDKRGGSKTLHWPENHSPDGDATMFDAVPLYTTPPKREWVGLTYEEIEELFQSAAGADEETVIRFARLIESKIKEKNT